MGTPHPVHINTAMRDFRRARNQAVIKEILSRFTGESTNLLSYDEVRRKLHAQGGSSIGLRDIPLEAIVGSVGRYTDFTRDFLPKKDSDQERWARVKAAMEDLVGLPPIEVYKIGEIYFVKDGNHRVSIARQLGSSHIQAYVTEVRTRVPVAPDIQPDEIIIKAEYVHFLERTHLDILRPSAHLDVSAAGKYPILEEHIAVHRYYMGLEEKREIPYEEAVTHWYDHVYLPIVEVIRQNGILRYFPGRTEADLYLWLGEHRAEMEAAWGWEIKTETAALDLSEQAGSRENILSRLGERILNAIPLEVLEDGPPPGQWRQETIARHHGERLFADLLVPLRGNAQSWYALDQALVIAGREGSQIHGLHISPADEPEETQATVQQDFIQRCETAGQNGHFIVRDGDVAAQITDQSRFTDLVVMNITYPPPERPLERLDSGIHELIQRCPRPILATPETVSSLNRLLLAYDGSPKANEALYIAAYLAGSWQIPLVVMTVFDDDKIPPETLLKAGVYLEEHQIEATFAAEHGAKAAAILNTADRHDCDFILTGGYGASPLLKLFLDSTVDQILRKTPIPLLICR